MWSCMTALEKRMLADVDFDRVHFELERDRIKIAMYTERELEIIKYFWNTVQEGKYLKLINKERRHCTIIMGNTRVDDIGGGQICASSLTSFRIQSWAG